MLHSKPLATGTTSENASSTKLRAICHINDIIYNFKNGLQRFTSIGITDLATTDSTLSAETVFDGSNISAGSDTTPLPLVTEEHKADSPPTVGLLFALPLGTSSDELSLCFPGPVPLSLETELQLDFFRSRLHHFQSG